MAQAGTMERARRPFGGKRRLVNAVEVDLAAPGPSAFFDAGELAVRPGDALVVDTERGKVLARARGLVQRRVLPVRDLGRVVRRATEQDLGQHQELVALEQEAMRFCVKRIRARRLPMKLVQVEMALDRNRTIFYFSSEERVDFRQLVRDLATEIKTRVELRQIGVRDGAGVVGGIGPCGKELCCSTFLTDFSSVSVRFAKNQGISLNPQKVTGMCGRLKCCLVYEHPVYKDLKRYMPRKGRHVLTPRGPGVVQDIDTLARTVRVRFEAMSDASWPIRDLVILDGPLDPETARRYMSREQEVLARRRMRRGGNTDGGVVRRDGGGILQETYIWTDVEADLSELPSPSEDAVPTLPGAGAPPPQASPTDKDGKPRRSRRRRRGGATGSQQAVSDRSASPQGAPGEPDGEKRRRRRRGGRGGGQGEGSQAASPGPQGGPSSGSGQAADGKPQGRSGGRRRRRRRGGGGSGGDGGGGGAGGGSSSGGGQGA